MNASIRTAGLIVLMCLCASACSGSTVRTSQIDLQIWMGNGQAWTASELSVRSEQMCDGGSHRWVGYRALDGSLTDYDEARALKRTQPALVLLETQLTCSDGTGSFSIAWEPAHDDRWIIVGGSGAFLGATGGGRLEQPTGGDADRPILLSGEIIDG